jgi:hypothetical protein
MNAKYLTMLLILPLITVGLTNFQDIDAAKSKGTPLLATTSSKVCGDKLCTDVPGGKASMQEKLSKKTEEMAEKKAMTEKEIMKEKDSMMEKDSMTEKEAMMEESGYDLRLARTNVPATIPLHKGWYEGQPVYFIITDASEQNHADIITEKQGWRVELAPLLASAPKKALSTTYIFTNGISGDGIHGFQGEIFTSTPEQSETYSALTAHVHVTWNDAAKAELLDSEDAILEAEKEGAVILTDLSVVINMPQIVWPGGHLTVKEDKTLTDETPYGGGQVLDIDTEKMTVTFVAHRGWGPDGRTIYYIVTDATPEMPAAMMGVVSSPTSAALIVNSAAVDLYQFANGAKGTGPLGFQPGIAAAAPGDPNYSPMWRIFVIDWKDPASASVLETIQDINAYKKAGLIDVNLARPMDSDHIVNCPFIDPFQ